MSRLPRVATLMGLAGGCGIGIGCMMLLLRREVDSKGNQAFFVKRAIEIMKEEPKCRELLGGQIEVGRATFSDGWSKLRTLNVQVRLPIKGEHDNAYLFAYARRRDENDRLRLYKLEATFEKIANRKLVILDRTNQEDEEEEEKEKVPTKEEEESVVTQVKEAREPVKQTKENFKEQMKKWASQ